MTAARELSLDRLTDRQRAHFGRVFLESWMSNGFGAMSKKDTELLIFACLDDALVGDGVVRNYDWAQTLKVPPSKVKSMRLESHLRFSHLFEDKSADARAQRLLRSIDSLQFDLDPADPALAGQVLLLLEDPVVKMEVEQAVKDMGGIPEYRRNREVLALSLEHFLRLAAQALGTGEEKLFVELAVKLRDDQSAQSRAKKELSKASYKQLKESEKLKRGLRGMAEAVLGKRLKLFDELATIFSSQKYKGTFRKPAK